MIKDRHLGVSRDVMRSVWRSHLPVCLDREKYVMWCHAFIVKVTFTCFLGQRNTSSDVMRSMWRSYLPVWAEKYVTWCHAINVKVTFTYLFGQREICHVMSCGQCRTREICHVMSCDQCEGHICLFVWTGRYLKGKICYPLLIWSLWTFFSSSSLLPKSFSKSD